MMKSLRWAAIQAVILLGWIPYAYAAQPQFPINVELEGFQEVPAVSTTGEGSFSLHNDRHFEFNLEYDLEGEITQAHIHFGQQGVNGGVMIWLCADPFFIDHQPFINEPPLDTPECQGSRGSITQQLTRSDIIGPEVQGIEPGQGAKALEAMLAGVAYVNVHSTYFPGGEIRGQFKFRRTSNDDVGHLWEALDELQAHFEGHTHTYLTGRGSGHNNTEATSSSPEF